MNRLGILTAALLGVLTPALAQTPFDMSPESDLVVPVPETVAPSPAQPVPAPVAAPSFTRYVLPDPALRLDGEESREAAVVYLTQAQAEAPARLQFAYLNALVVAPEVSSLSVRINGTEITSSAIASSSSPAEVSVAVPAGLLRPGANVVEFRARQRHRTDCSVGSTYELWTELQAGNVRLVFDGAVTGSVTQIGDLAAVGVDATGATTVRIMRGMLDDPQAASTALQLMQQLAIALRVADLHVETVDALSTQYQPGVLDLVVMPAADLGTSFPQAQAQAASGPLAAMLSASGGANVLVVSGPDWTAIRRAGDALLTSAPLTPSAPRIDLPIPHPLMLGGQTVQLSELGVDTIEFNGRRFNTQLQFELPPDFYAYRYGELELVLDAAYSGDVQPGSEIDIYTNGQIASATPLLRTDGGMLRDTVIRIPMTSLRPGRNEVAISVNLLTESDAVCSAGWTGQAPTRFVLSNTSQLRLPDYARAASVPDLLTLAGPGWPYAGSTTPIALGTGSDTLVSAMLMLARIAAASGNVLPVEIVPASDLPPDRNAIVVMPLGEMPPPVLAASGVLPAVAATAGRNDSVLNQFGTDQQNTGPWTAPAQWLLDRVGLSLDDLRVMPGVDAPYAPETGAVVMSQIRRAEGGIWTMLSSGDAASLREGTSRLVITPRWREIAGRISALGPQDDQVTVIQAANPAIIETQPTTPANLRLVAANWFSGNILYFAGAIILAAVLLMAATSFVLSQIGRRQ